METWRSSWQEELGLAKAFVQDNHAKSTSKGVLRGLHFQAAPHAQSKLIWASQGAIFDVAVDLRTKSPTFGQWFGIELSATNFLRLYVPKGFAHGYMTISDICEVQYKVDEYYNAASDGGIIWDDKDLGIKWPCQTPILSEKDAQLPLLKNLQNSF